MINRSLTLRCSEFLTKLANRGVRVTLHEDEQQLIVQPFSRVMPNERLALQQHKDKFIRYFLNQRAQGEPVEPTESGVYWFCTVRNKWIDCAVEDRPKEFFGTMLAI